MVNTRRWRFSMYGTCYVCRKPEGRCRCDDDSAMMVGPRDETGLEPLLNIIGAVLLVLGILAIGALVGVFYHG